MTLYELLECQTEDLFDSLDFIFEDEEILESKKKRDKKRANKFKPGRERLITTIQRRLNKMGVSLSKSKIRDYAYEKYKLWKQKDKSVNWILHLEHKANALGFDPRWQEMMGPGHTDQKNSQEGRSYFFVGLINGYIKDLSANKKRKLKKGDEQQ